MTKQLRFSHKAEKLLREIGKKKRFTLYYSNRVRTNDGWECPVCAIANDIIGERKWTVSYLAASKEVKLGLTFNTLNTIVEAADFESNPLRPRLLHLLGMNND